MRIPSLAISRTALPRLCAVALALFGFFPVANWIVGGHQAEWYDATRAEWVSGSLLALGIAVVVWIVARRLPLWPEGWGTRAAAWANAHPVRTGVVLCLTACAVYSAIALLVFSGKPLLIDEIAQVIQARIFASRRLTVPSSALPEFFGILHMASTHGHTFSQFPPGGPLMLLPGVLVGAPWLTGPVFGAASVLLYWLLLRRIESRPTASLGAALLFAFAPFMAFMAGSHMNHVTTLFWLCAALFFLSEITREDVSRPWLAAACGFSFGMMATIRPTDAVVFAIPAAVWFVSRAIRSARCWRDVLSAGIALALPLLGLLAFNAATTGRPLLFGYELLWGKSHALGFHRAPWGVTHTPARGVELVSLYFLRLQTYLFETPIPSLLPCMLALSLTPMLRGFDRYLLWSSVLLVLSYFAYWHDGFYLGPRFFYLLLPVLALWTARLPGLVATRFRGGAARFVLMTYLSAACIAVIASLPLRTRQYQGGLISMRRDYARVSARANVRNALILVKESWGAQVISRMWAIGIPHSETETLYRGVDTCRLDSAVTELETLGRVGSTALTALTPLLEDSARVVKSTFSPDETERVLPGSTYGESCLSHIADDRLGYTFLAPIFAGETDSNVYARELGARDTLLFAALPGRAVYTMRPASTELGAPLLLVPFSIDSARRSWARTTGR